MPSHGAADLDTTKPAKQRLLDAAIEVFAQRGYEGASVREICGAAGANVNAVKYYFEDKHKLYLEALREAHAEVHAQVLGDKALAATADERFRRFVHNMMRTLLSDCGKNSRHLLLIRELMAPTDGTELVVDLFIRPRFTMLTQALQELAPDADPAKIRLIGNGVIGQCMHYKMAMPIVQLLTPDEERQQYDAEHLANHIIESTLAVLHQANNKNTQH